jgi:hypothetical protein
MQSGMSKVGTDTATLVILPLSNIPFRPMKILPIKCDKNQDWIVSVDVNTAEDVSFHKRTHSYREKYFLCLLLFVSYTISSFFDSVSSSYTHFRDAFCPLSLRSFRK